MAGIAAIALADAAANAAMVASGYSFGTTMFVGGGILAGIAAGLSIETVRTKTSAGSKEKRRRISYKPLQGIKRGIQGGGSDMWRLSLKRRKRRIEILPVPEHEEEEELPKPRRRRGNLNRWGGVVFFNGKKMAYRRTFGRKRRRRYGKRRFRRGKRYLRKRVGRLGRLLRDTRGRGELKRIMDGTICAHDTTGGQFGYGGTPRNPGDQCFGSGASTDREMEIPLMTSGGAAGDHYAGWCMLMDCAQGTLTTQRSGDKVQVRELKCRGTLVFMNSYATVNCMIFKVRATSDSEMLTIIGTAGGLCDPQTWLLGVQTAPNTSYFDADSVKDIRGRGVKLIAWKQWTTTELKQNIRFALGIKFKVGKRPIVTYENTNNRPVSHQYIMLWWCDQAYDEEAPATGATIKGFTSKMTYYDS